MRKPIDILNHKKEISEIGFTTIGNIYSGEEITQIRLAIEKADSTRSTFRKSSDLFAIRQFLKEVPESFPIIFSDKFKSLLAHLLGSDFFVVKSIYFDKPETSNWYVAYHQDLTISVDKKADVNGFESWTVKQDQFAVQPTIDILENIVTVRIHLDDTDESNGALKVIPKSHLKKIQRPESINWAVEEEVSCNVIKGGVMLMKPLLLHSSGRTLNHRKRRVVHIEFSNKSLPKELNWSERMPVF